MLTQYHIEIMLASFGNRFSPLAMSTITYANINQDRITGQFGHDEFHFDNNAFDKSYAYMEQQRTMTLSSLQKKDPSAAWSAFGRMLHTAQDFYAHSNYVTLWVSRFKEGALPAPTEIDPVDPSLLHSLDLRSGKVYFPLEILYFPRISRAFALHFLPRDSHAWMNLDTPEQGFKFDYAMQAAIKKTVMEFEKTTAGMSEELCRLFLDR